MGSRLHASSATGCSPPLRVSLLPISNAVGGSSHDGQASPEVSSASTSGDVGVSMGLVGLWIGFAGLVHGLFYLINQDGQ